MITLVPLVLVLYTVIAKGITAISWQFLTGSPIPPNVLPLGVGGMAPAIIGTLEITAFAALIAIPLGVLGAIYINEYGGKGWLARLIAFMADVMTGVPSIVMGLFIFTIWMLHFGYSGVAGSFALACLMLPIVIRSTYEMLLLVPDQLREASYALGATKSRVTLTIVLPAAIGGIVSGALLAVARAAGETAPLLFVILSTQDDEHEPVLRRQHGAADADLRQRAVTVRRRRRARLGRGAHAHRHHLRPDARRPPHHRPVHPLHALGIPMEQPEQEAEVVAQTVSTNLPRLETTVKAPDTETPRATIFDVQNVSIWYGSFKAVTDVSLPIYEHEVTAFIGSSGSGKSTVLRAFNRMNDLVPGARVDGTMTYRGADLYARDVSAAAVRRRIGMVFQKPNPFPKSIYDNVAYGPRINGERNKAKLDEIVERSLRSAALWDEVKNRLKQSGLALSGGQAQRLCIARTIAVEPDVVLMDEPASALDPIATLAIEDLIRELKQNYTIVIVTHNMQQATRVSDRTAFFSVLTDSKNDTRTGILVEYGPTQQIFEDPHDDRTQAYVTGRIG